MTRFLTTEDGSVRGITNHTSDTISTYACWGNSVRTPINQITRCRSRVLCFITFCGQASECMSRMPRHTKAMKDAVSCDKPGGAAHTL